MKAKIVVLAVLLLLMASVAVSADAYAYDVLYHTDNTVLWFGAWPGASPTYDSRDISTTTLATAGVEAVFYRQRGVDGWDAPNCFLRKDARPLLQAGETEVFNDLYIWAGTATPPQTLSFTRYPGPISSALAYTLRLVQIPVGVFYSGPREWDADHDTISLPFYATDNPLTGYRFQVEITAVPEPSSLLVLVAGLGVVGAACGRRKKQAA